MAAPTFKDLVFRRGVQGGSTFWLLVGAVGILKRAYDRGGRKTETIRLGERLRPGDELVMTYPGKPSRKTRKEKKVIAKRSAAADRALAKRVAKLSDRAAKRGLRARKARAELAALTGKPR